nr:hypothetical protein CFP56_13417 [Quercus suber]
MEPPALASLHKGMPAFSIVSRDQDRWLHTVVHESWNRQGTVTQVGRYFTPPAAVRRPSFLDSLSTLTIFSKNHLVSIMNASRDQLRNIFRPHQFDVGQQYIDLYHVYDDLSRTQFYHGTGIQCEDSRIYVMDAWHVITPRAMLKHLDWGNREATQFISFYADHGYAVAEQQRRMNQPFVSGVGYRNRHSVRIAHVRLARDSNVWVFSRQDLLNMMQTNFPASVRELWVSSGPQEWFVWGTVPETFVYNRRQFAYQTRGYLELKAPGYIKATLTQILLRVVSCFCARFRSLMIRFAPIKTFLVLLDLNCSFRTECARLSRAEDTSLGILVSETLTSTVRLVLHLTDFEVAISPFSTESTM